MKHAIKQIFIAIIVLSLIKPADIAIAGPRGLDIINLPEWEVSTASQGGRLLLSDSPEMVESDGILYQDKVEGAVRLFYYHVNAASAAKKFDVILENNSNKPVRVTVRQYGMSGPGYAWMAIGKETMAAYLAGSQPYQLDIPPGGAKTLMAQISETAVLPNMLVNGMFDFTADRQVTVKVLMLPMLEDSESFARTAKILEPDRHHLRGTFEGANRQLVADAVYDPAKDGAVAVTLADNRIDCYVEGIDATNGRKVINYGNYGVVYQIALLSKSGGKVAYYLVPRGGDYAGVIGIAHPDVTWSPLPTPLGRVHFGSNKAEDFAFLGTYDSGDPLLLTFSPPGASNLPVKILILPQ